MRAENETCIRSKRRVGKWGEKGRGSAMADVKLWYRKVHIIKIFKYNILYCTIYRTVLRITIILPYGKMKNARSIDDYKIQFTKFVTSCRISRHPKCAAWCNPTLQSRRVPPYRVRYDRRCLPCFSLRRDMTALWSGNPSNTVLC